MRRSHRELPTRLQDWRPDFTARRVRWWWLADAGRYQYRSRWRRLGDEQLAGRRHLLRPASRGAVYALRRPRRCSFLRHGQAGARAADRTSATTVICWEKMTKIKAPASTGAFV